MKKALSLALALALCMGLFSGCGTETGSNSTSQPAQSSGETVKTVTWASTSDNRPGPQKRQLHHHRQHSGLPLQHPGQDGPPGADRVRRC